MNNEHVSVGSRKVIPILFWVGIFSIAMGFLEAIVVVYLRKIYYPGGFMFPMSPVSPQVYGVDLVREVATLVMLVSLSMIWIGISLILLDKLDGPLVLRGAEWLLLIAGGGLIFISFIWNYMGLIVRGGFLPQFFFLAENRQFLQIVYDYVPEDFNWFLFFAGELLVVFGMFKVLYRYRQVVPITARDLLRRFRLDRHKVFHHN